jgi:hypothetical protein
VCLSCGAKALDEARGEFATAASATAKGTAGGSGGGAADRTLSWPSSVYDVPTICIRCLGETSPSAPLLSRTIHQCVAVVSNTSTESPFSTSNSVDDEGATVAVTRWYALLEPRWRFSAFCACWLAPATRCTSIWPSEQTSQYWFKEQSQQMAGAGQNLLRSRS